MIPILASYAALQDCDGIFFYTFETKISGKWTPMIGDHFDMTLDPVKMAQMPAGAMIFLRGDVSAAKEVMTRSYSTDQISEASRMPRAAMPRSEEHTSELQSLMRISYAVFCLKKKHSTLYQPQYKLSYIVIQRYIKTQH